MRQSSNPGTLLSLWKQFLPLSLSDVTMAFGDPAVTATMAQLPNARVNIAAVGIAKSLAVFFESPIIMILHASNTLAGSKRSREALKRFTWIAIGVLSAALLVLAFPPVFGAFANKVLGISPELAKQARTVLFLMVLWPAAIAWRRYCQGLLIYSGHGNTVARAGLLRLAFVAVVLSTGYALSVPGAILAGAALIGGVLAEAAAVTISSKRHGVEDAPEKQGAQSLPTNFKDVWKFYWPLANSMIVVWGGRALLIAIVARAVDGPIALAIWPAAWGLVLLVANSTRMVQQVIIRNKREVETGKLFQFALTVGLVASGILLLLGVTPWGQRGVAAFVGFDAALYEGVLPVILLCSLVPILVATQNAIQGFLIGDGRTHRVNVATWLGTSVLLTSAFVAIGNRLPGATAAAIAMLLGLAAETVVLATGVYSFRWEKFPLTRRPGWVK